MTSPAPPPVLFVTNHVPPDRAGAFAALHALVPLELALFGGRSHHATAGVADPGVPFREVAQRDVFALASSGGYSAVVCGTAGRVALPAAWLGARRGRIPFVLWSALWAPLRTPAHLLAAPMMRRIHGSAACVVTYGPHVSAYAKRLGAREVVEAPQAVDVAFWSEGARGGGRGRRTAGEPDTSRPAGSTWFTTGGRRRPFTAVFVGRDAPGKGLEVLLEAWRQVDGPAQLRLVGVDEAAGTQARGDASPARESSTAEIAPHDSRVQRLGHAGPTEVRNFLATSDVLVVPSVPTPAFKEPWALVTNEAMHQGIPVIATDAVGAAAGGLVRHERNGLVVPAADPAALAAAIRRLRDDAPLRARLAAAARRDAAVYTFDAWASGFATGLERANTCFHQRPAGYR